METKKKTVVICGAGADRAAGMPLASELIPRINEFLTTKDGKAVDESLRDVLPYLRFTYNKLAHETVQNMLNYRGQIVDIMANINYELSHENIKSSDRYIGDVIIKTLESIQKFQESVQISPETRTLLEGFPQKSLFGYDNSDSFDIIDLSKSSFTVEFDAVVRNLLDMALRDPSNHILRHLITNLINFEHLLTDSFLGIYTSDVGKIKRYIYQAWTLWAFLKHQENTAYSKYPDGKPFPFYSSLPSNWDIITLNYTSFALKYSDNSPYYFHGELSNYTKMNSGVKCSMDKNIDPVDFIKSTVAIETMKDADDSYTLPCIIPPLKSKPAFTGLIDTWGFIGVWHKSREILDYADKIVIVGYSFNYADEHLNDIIRHNKDKDILIVDKYPKNILKSVRNIFSYDPDDYIENSFQGKVCYEKGNLKVVGAEATEIDWRKI